MSDPEVAMDRSAELSAARRAVQRHKVGHRSQAPGGPVNIQSRNPRTFLDELKIAVGNGQGSERQKGAHPLV